MTAVDAEQLRGGACMELPLAVVDKYFAADRNTDYFAFLTAKAICGHCAVQAACLIDAIQLPATDGDLIRGGESATAIEQLHRRFIAGDGPAEVLALTAIRRQRREGGVGGSRRLRAGCFPDAQLIEQ